MRLTLKSWIGVKTSDTIDSDYHTSNSNKENSRMVKHSIANYVVIRVKYRMTQIIHTL